MMEGNKLLAPGELTEGQFALAQDFCRFVNRTRERLSQAAAQLEAAGIRVSHADFERLYWQLVDLDTPLQQVMLDHIAACVDKQRGKQ